MIMSIFQGLVLIVLLYITNLYSQALGGLIYSSFVLPIRLPYVGRIFYYLTQGPLKLSIVVKMLSWIVGATGILLGIGIYSFIWHFPSSDFELWIVLFFALHAALDLLKDMLDFSKIASVDDAMDYIGSSKMLRSMIGENTYSVLTQNKELQKRLGYLQFIDMHLPQLFRLLVSIGVLFFALGELNLFEIETGKKTLSIWESILFTVSAILPFDKVNPPYTGNIWIACKFFSSLCIFVWTVFYIAISVSILFVEPEDNFEPVEVPIDNDPVISMNTVNEEGKPGEHSLDKEVSKE